MKELPLRIKIKDAAKYHAKQFIFPMILGAGIAAYKGTDLTQHPIYILIGLLAVFLTVIIISSVASNLTLTENGFMYTNMLGKTISRSWQDSININKTPDAHGNYVITDQLKNKRIIVAAVIFKYPEVKAFINEHCPQDHKLRELASDS